MESRFLMYPLVPQRLTNFDPQRILGRSAFSTEVNVYNFTHVVVTVTHRNGIAYEVIPCTPGHPQYRNCVVVQTKMRTTKGVINYMACKLNAPPEQLSTAAQELIKFHDSDGWQRQAEYCTVSYECVFDYAELANGEEFYIADSDLCVTTKRIVDAAPHPYSRDAEVLLHERGAYFGDMISVRVIDNAGTRRSVFMPYCGVVYEIPVEQDMEKESGVYIAHRRNAFDRNGEKLPKGIYFDLNKREGQYYQIFDTKPAAFEYLRRDEHNELELARLKHETETMKVELEQIKLDFGMREAQYKTREMELKAANLEIEKNLAAEKMRAESRMSFRKEILETIKLVSPVAGLVQLIIKLRQATTGS